MKTRLYITLALLLLGALAPPAASAQDDYSLFRARAGNASLLYRGHKAFDYTIAYNGTYWWSDPEFHEGEVIYNEKRYEGIYLNIDAARQDLVVRTGYGVSLKALERSLVRECSFAGKRFLNLQYIKGPDAPLGWWEVLYDGQCRILRRVNKSLEQDIEGRKQEQTHYAGEFRYNVYQVFTWSADYLYESPEGELKPLKRRGDVLRLFDKERRRQVRRSLHERDAMGRLPFDIYCVEAAKYLESR